MKTVGHFGSAGSSRSLRRTATAVAAGSSTAAVQRMKPQAANAIADFATKEEMLEAVRTGQCYLCDSPQTYRSMGQHWIHSHGINLAELRDELMLPKRFPLVTEETSARHRAHGLEVYPLVASQLRPKKGEKKELGRYGRAINRAKLQAIPRTPALMKPCPECGQPMRASKDQTTCGAPACKHAARSAAQRKRRDAEKLK